MIIRFFAILKACVYLSVYWKWNHKKKNFHEQFAVKIRNAFEDLGATFIKLGQILSMRPDFIPSVYCSAWEILLDHAPIISARVIRRRIEAEFQKPISNIFQKFYNKPVASASLSQVHRATLWTGEEVAVKVLRPGVERLIRSDIKILRIAAWCVGNRIGKMPKTYWRGLIEQLSMWLHQETDYRIEKENMEIIRRQFVGYDDLAVPDTFDEWCSHRVLTMEFIDAPSLSDIIRRKRMEPDIPLDEAFRERMIRLGDQLFEISLQNGYVHGDVHPANILCTENGVIYFIDFGLIQYFDIHLRNHLILFLMGATFASPELLVRASRKIGKVPDDFNETEFYASFCRICESYKDVPASEMSNSEFLILCVNECLRHGIVIPWSVVIFARSTTGFDGIILKLYPDYVFSAHSRSVFLKIYAGSILKQLWTVPGFVGLTDDILDILKEVPSGLRTFVQAFGKAKV